MRKVLFFILIFAQKIFFAQLIIEEEFDAGTTAPGGWTFTSIGATLASVGNYGKSSPSILFDGTGDRVVTAVFVAGTANEIAFWCQSSTGTTTNPIDVEYRVGGVWTACTGSPFVGVQSTARTCVMTFPNTAVQLRLTYTRTLADNVSIDDIMVYNNSGAGCTAANFLQFNAITYNSCNNNVCEGTDEFLTFFNGSTALNISNLEIEFPTSGGPTTYCGNSTTPCDNFFQTNAAYVALLGGVAGCSAANFLTPPGGVIPANSRVLVFGGNPPTTTIDFGLLCASGAVFYVIFGSNTTDCQGKYSNSSANQRFTSIRNRSTGCSVERVFIPSTGAGLDGDVVAFSSAGVPTFVSNASCAGFKILPIELVDFYATKNAKKNDIVWKVASEENVIYYTIDKSNDGVNFKELASVFSNNSESQRKAYNVVDDAPFDDITYYRLGTKEKDGKVNYYKIISVEEKSSDWNSIHYQQEQNLVIEFKNTIPKNSTINLFDLSGKLLVEQAVKESQTTINTQAFAEGIYFVKITTPYKTENFKIIISK